MLLHSCAERNWQIIRCDKRATYEIVKAGYRQASFLWQVLCDKFYLPSARVYMQSFSMTSFHMTSFIYWCECVRKRCLSPPWQKNYNSPLANHIKCSDYFDKFSLLTHTDEQNLYFDNFFYDKCTSLVQKLASFWTSALVTEKIVKVARTDEQIKLVT
jgi:hypothetical protein